MKDILITYKNYLHCLQWIKEFGNKYGDEDVLLIFEKELKKNMNKNPQTLDELMELIKDKNFRPSCSELEKIIDRVYNNETQDTKFKVKKKQRGE